MPNDLQGAIGLALDHNLNAVRRLGLSTYNQWFTAGLTRVEPEQANLSPYQFKKAFSEAAEQAPRIVFDVTDLDVTKAIADGVQGFVSRNYTNAELHLITINPSWLAKTTFLHQGSIATPVFQNGQLIGFESPEKDKK